MKKYLSIISIMIISTIHAVCFAIDSVSPEVSQALKNQTAEPGLSQIMFALIVVVALIYITGLIYSKLNIVGAKTVQNQLKNYDLSRVVVLSTTQLGPNKNLHVIELNSKRYLIGATPSSINLIRELEPASKLKNENDEEILEESSVDEAIDVLYGTEEEEPILQLKLEPVDEFDIHKKYL